MKSKFVALAATALLSTLSYAAEPDTQVIEYYHPALKHYFITASATDARFVDSGGAGADWVRTGRGFGAWSRRDSAPAGAAMVYRFYSPGANSHFYTASDDEVRLLKNLEANERASIAGTGKNISGWGYEGEAFLAVLPTNGQCPAGTETITRVYNEGFTTGEGSNHRYLNDDALKHSMEDRNWAVEGTVFCSPISSASAGTSSSNSNAVASGNYSGAVLFKIEEAGKPEVKMRVPFALMLAADGALSASGSSCTFAGTAIAGSDSRLRAGTVTATGCGDARFNGTYSRVEIEQFGDKAIDVRFKQGDNARELQIEGVLTNDVTSTPATPTSTPTPAPADSSLIAGDFSGISTWLVTERLSGQAETIAFNVNQRLSLNITSAGAVSGTGQGCTFGGTLNPAVDNRFIGSITASGCTEPRLNGSYAAEIHAESGGTIEAQFERELEQGGMRTKASIEGELSRSATGTSRTTPTPPLSGTGPALAGSYSGSASWLATRRPAGGREATVVDKTQTLTLTVSSAGVVTGAGAGCTFSGSLTISNAALSTFAGSITASGCTDSIINGNFTGTATLENGNALALELQRETETNGERVKVNIRGRLTGQ